MQRIVIDTNIIVSALISPIGNPAKSLVISFCKENEICYSREIMLEYRDVLFRSTFNFDIEHVNNILNRIIQTGMVIETEPSKIKMIDETDRKFYDAAESSGAVLITGNKRHYPSESFILTPAEFLERFK